jgi:hypothetical protein
MDHGVATVQRLAYRSRIGYISNHEGRRINLKGIEGRSDALPRSDQEADVVTGLCDGTHGMRADETRPTRYQNKHRRKEYRAEQRPRRDSRVIRRADPNHLQLVTNSVTRCRQFAESAWL